MRIRGAMVLVENLTRIDEFNAVKKLEIGVETHPINSLLGPGNISFFGKSAVCRVGEHCNARNISYLFLDFFTYRCGKLYRIFISQHAS